MNEPEDRDWIEAVLRTTGRRPAVPSDRSHRVEAIVRAHWRDHVRTRTRSRAIWVAGSLAAAAAVTAAAVIGLDVWQRRGPAAVETNATAAEVVVAPAWSRPPSDSGEAALAAVRPGDGIAIGSELTTEGPGRLAIRMATGHSLRLDLATKVRVVSENIVELERGSIYVDSSGGGRAAKAPLEIRTPVGSIRDIGTQFEARLSEAGSLRVCVREGGVSLYRSDSQLAVRAGEVLEVNTDGTTSRHQLAGFGGEWAWVGEVTPMMDLEGRTLDDFLAWMARERGLRLELASPRVAATARATTLNGSIRGMTLDEALDSVLSTCRMRHRIEGETLRVDSLDGNGGT